MMFANLLSVLLLQEECYKVPDTGVLGQAPIKQNQTKPNQTLWHLYSTCMGNIPWSSKAEEYNVEPIGCAGEEKGEVGCCVRRLLWRLLFICAWWHSVQQSRGILQYSCQLIPTHSDVKIQLIAVHGTVGSLAIFSGRLPNSHLYVYIYIKQVNFIYFCLPQDRGHAVCS